MNPREDVSRSGMRLILLALLFTSIKGLGAEVSGQGAGKAHPEDDLPKWEIGVVGLGARLPHYRGSDEYKLYAFPVPYLIYRGDVIQVEREGVRGLFYKGERVETDLSFQGNPPVFKNNNARRGMPELDPLLEMGPAARFFFYRGETLTSLYLEAAVRGVTSVRVDDFRFRYEGNRASLTLVADSDTPRRVSPWRFGASTGIDFADAHYNSYFYDVSDDQVLPDRAAYHSAGGYGGWNLSGYVLREVTPCFFVSVYARWDNLDGAVYEDSPLVKARNNYVLGAAVIWKLAESENRVKFR